MAHRAVATCPHNGTTKQDGTQVLEAGGEQKLFCSSWKGPTKELWFSGQKIGAWVFGSAHTSQSGSALVSTMNDIVFVCVFVCVCVCVLCCAAFLFWFEPCSSPTEGGNVSAPGARRASFVTRALPVDCCGRYVGQHYMDLPLGPRDISRCFDLGWVWTFSYPR